ncbi:protein CANDIDATE G-PROTEIN COUPLED RECEPTOR 7 [Lolium rigidum]|uniref:protein CANDIDATE G-PROTEIN COUPLED RECEPTOR 7 n=1 Tax=Lolium rigidum TaxID=89674 RepID=UPI001F5D1BAA|nr:protein CANDIDATE G-PROTEIN COUPLED RECEPTOR 7 [Lolium rigidum]
MAAPPLAAVLLGVLALVAFPAAAEIRETVIRADPRTIIPLDEFGFSHQGTLELNVSGIAFDPPASSDLDLSQFGFFLSTLDAWVHVLRQLQDLDVTCALQSDLVKLAYSFDRLKPAPNPAGVAVARSSSFTTAFRVSEPGQYTLVFANCLTGGNLKVSMDVSSAMYNVDPATGERAYLSVGSAALPSIYFLLCVAYAGLVAAWVSILLRKRAAVFRIHYFMLAVLVLKAFNLLAEAEDKSYIERTGTAHGWDVLFYIFSFFKGISLFTLIVLIGTGWSFLKPYLADREKKVLMVVIPLQVVANIAQVVIDESGPYARDWVTWRQIFLLVDVVCCCAVLFPIVWSIKNLREAARSDGKAAVNLMKLTLFRQYYVVVICYIYFTRVVVYALVTITSYRYLWTSVLAGEIATLAFYVFTGYRFRPEVHNPYFAIDDDEEEAAAEALKLDDEFEL